MEMSLAEHFRIRAPTFDKNAPWVTDEEILLPICEYLNSGSVQWILDVGAGTGKVGNFLARQVPSIKEIVAVDLSLEMLKRADSNSLGLVQADAHYLPIASGAFDGVICRQALHYFLRPLLALKEMHRVLGPNGILVVAQITPFPEDDKAWWRTILNIKQPLRKHFLTFDSLCTLLCASGFKVRQQQIRRGYESLRSWLNRYPHTEAEKRILWKLHDQAPPLYQEVHRFRRCIDDIEFDICWTYVVGEKVDPASQEH